jgi:hypothetical protein
MIPLSILAFAASLAVSASVMFTTGKYGFDNCPKGEDSFLKVPEPANPAWEVHDEISNTYSTSFKSKTLPSLPEAPSA